jgi:hypothetical protein
MQCGASVAELDQRRRIETNGSIFTKTSKKLYGMSNFSFYTCPIIVTQGAIHGTIT